MDEYISRENVLNNSNIITVQTKEYGSIEVIPVDTIADIELADVQPVKHGKWIECCNEFDKKCSCCDKVHGTIYEREPFCPNCGAKMDGDIMTDAELQRLERCKKCSKSTEADDFQGGTELYCPLHGYPCDMIIQCVYVPDNKRYE